MILDKRTMENCPACHRKLISHISPRCNWCGHEIQDTAYQAEAEVRREAHALEEAQHAAQVRQRYQSSLDPYALNDFGIYDPFAPPRLPHFDMSQEVRQRMAAEAAILAEAARARQAQAEYAAHVEQQRQAAEQERQARLREQAAAAKEAQDDRFNHLEL